MTERAQATPSPQEQQFDGKEEMNFDKYRCDLVKAPPQKAFTDQITLNTPDKIKRSLPMLNLRENRCNDVPSENGVWLKKTGFRPIES